MPWLIKYRVFHEQRCSDSVKDQLSEIQLKLEEEEEPMTAIAGNVMDTGAVAVGAVDTGAQFVKNAGIGVTTAGIGAVGDAVRDTADLFRK
jgi:hypothetical protein